MTIYRIFAPLVIVSLIEIVMGCSSIENLEIEHVVMFNKDGRPIDPTGNIECKEETPLCNGSHLMFKEYRLSKPEYWDHCEEYPDLAFGWNDLIDSEGVAKKLLHENQAAIKSLREQLSLRNQKLLKAYDSSKEFSHELDDALICHFDHIVRKESIFDSHWFRSPDDPADSRVLLTEDTWKLAESKPQGEITIRRLNRLLLAELFPDEIRKRAHDFPRRFEAAFVPSESSIMARILSASSRDRPRYSINAVTISSGDPAKNRSTIWVTRAPSETVRGTLAE